MLASIRKSISLPYINLELLATVFTASAFVWLLARGVVRPIAIYLLELYLTF